METGHGTTVVDDGQDGQGTVTVVIDGGGAIGAVSHETQIGASYLHTPALAVE